MCKNVVQVFCFYLSSWGKKGKKGKGPRSLKTDTKYPSGFALRRFNAA